MAVTTFRQKLWLILFGMILTLAFLEFGLRLGGRVFVFLQEQKNRQSVISGGEYRILCLGESTTALGGDNAYPSQLEEILNRRQNKIVFKVINKGLPATTSDQIVARVPEYLREYKPRMIVSMIGINDPPRQDQPGLREVLSKYSKAFKLFDMIAAHLFAGSRENPAAILDREIAKLESRTSPDRISQINMQVLKANLYRGANRPEEEKAAIEKVLSIDKNNPDGWYLLGIYYERHAEYPRSLEALRKAVALGPVALKVSATEKMAQVCKFLKDYARAEKIYLDILAQNPRHPLAGAALGDIYMEQKKYPEAIKVYLQQLNADSSLTEVYGKLAHCYRLSGRPDLAESVFEKGVQFAGHSPEFFYEWGYMLFEQKKYAAAQKAYELAVKKNDQDNRGVNLRILERLRDCYAAQRIHPDLVGEINQTLKKEEGAFNPRTKDNYLALLKLARGQNIPVVAVQYPRRPVLPLKLMLSQEDGTTFVDNQKVFEDALKEYTYDEIFSDRFAGDFGHCTAKGNTLLAQNVAAAILERFSP